MLARVFIKAGYWVATLRPPKGYLNLDDYIRRVVSNSSLSTSLLSALEIVHTTAPISAGTVSEIEVSAPGEPGLIYPNDSVILVDGDTQALHHLTATEELGPSGTTLYISPYAFTTTIPTNSAIIFNYKTVLRARV